MVTTLQRPKSGSMNVTAFTKISQKDMYQLIAKGFKADRSVSYIIHQALIEAGYIGKGK